MRFLKVVRLSSIGVMLTGVGSAISGCSAEDAIKALLIWLALALGGGGQEETTTPGPLAGMQFADFTTNTPRSLGPAPCAGAGGGFGGGGGGGITALIPNLDAREINFGNFPGGGAGSITITVDNGQLTISTTDTCNTNVPLLLFIDGSNSNSVDFSGFSQVNLRVTSLTGGPVTDCMIEVFDNVNTPGVTSAAFDLSVGDTSVSIAGGVNMNAMNFIGFGDCDFNGATIIVLDPFHIE